MAIEFTPFDEIEWTGRYTRPYGKQGNYHVTHDGDIYIRSYQNYGLFADSIDYYALMDEGNARELASAITECKFLHSNIWAGTGGVFSINEYGIVIVPVNVSETSIRYYAIGKCKGGLSFRNRESGIVFDLNPDLRFGTQWNYPYLGMKFHLSAQDRFYFQNDEETGSNKNFLGQDNQKLRLSIRTIRHSGDVSFVVNNHGVVLVKKQDAGQEEYWQPYFAGRLDKTKWFPNEYEEMISRKNSCDNLMVQVSNMKKYSWSENDKEVFNEQKSKYLHNGRQIDSDMERELMRLINKYNH